MDFQLIFHGPYHFGDDSDFFDGSAERIFHRGTRVTWAFTLPGFRTGRGHAVLMFQSRNVNTELNKFAINGTALWLREGVPTWQDKKSWTTQLVTLDSNTLNDTGNTFSVEARDPSGRPDDADTDVDDFALADMVMLYYSSDQQSEPEPVIEADPLVQAEPRI